MSTNKMVNHLVTVECLNEKIGSGVIFASHDKSSHYYVLTAKHNFPDNLTDPSQLTSQDLKILFQKKTEITTNGLRVYFPHDHDDLALIVFESQEMGLKHVKSLKIYNTDPETDHKNKFVVIGYPGRTSESDFTQPHDNIFARVNGYDENSRLEVLKDVGSSTTHAIKVGTDYYAGMSGGAVFFEDQHKELQLRSIIKQYSGDSFSCVRLDQLVDEINVNIQQYSAELDPIEMGDLLFAGDEPIEIDEITNFDFFKSSINARLKSPKLWERYDLNEFQQKDYNIDKQSLQRIAEKLRYRRKRIRDETDELSYLFAYIAIASHNNKDYRLSTNYFLEATRLNPKHTQTLLLEKHDRKDKINKIEATSLADLTRKYELLLDREPHDLVARRSILIDALNLARTFDDRERFSVISEFEEKLIENYEQDSSLRYHHKYKELGDYLYNVRLNSEEPQESAFRFHTLSLKVAKLSPQTEQTIGFIKDLQESYKGLYPESFFHEYPNVIAESSQRAIDLILADEDPETKRMLLQMSAEINDLKALSFRQGESSREQARLLSSVSTDIGDQIYQTRQNTVKLNEASLSIIDTLEQTKNSSGAINSVNEATKGISSQLLRVENSALEIARELASKLGPETVVKEKKALQKSKIMFSSALFLLSVILVLLPYERAL